MSLCKNKLLIPIKFTLRAHSKCYCSKSNNSVVLDPYASKQLNPLVGQPTAETHPHLIEPGELMPGITLDEFQRRRRNLINSILGFSTKYDKCLTTHLIIIPSAIKKYMSDKIPYVFRQNSDFLYLSGCMEPDSCLVLSTDGLNNKSLLFVRPKDAHAEIWDGPRTGVEMSPELFGVDESLPVSEFGRYIGSFLKNNKKSLIWYDYVNASQEILDKQLRDSLTVSIHKRWESPQSFIHQLRLIKSGAEIALMRKSCEIASQAIRNTIEISQPGWTEHQIFANVDYESRMRGAEYLAYPPVVAGGNRATIIHYINNNQTINSGEMVLMDAGCEYHGYTSDISRTWPINGKFTDEQKVLYEIILEIQKSLITSCHNTISLDTLFDSMCFMLGQKLQEIGLISKQVKSEDLPKIAYKFCPHHVSHYLGMDVHDTTTIPRTTNLRPGMIITMEPGIYINDKMDVPEGFRGIGIRIEDDILITASGPVVLSQLCPKEVDDIERSSTA